MIIKKNVYNQVAKKQRSQLLMTHFLKIKILKWKKVRNASMQEN
jgi:hypothetical protein